MTNKPLMEGNNALIFSIIILSVTLLTVRRSIDGWFIFGRENQGKGNRFLIPSKGLNTHEPVSKVVNSLKTEGNVSASRG